MKNLVKAVMARQTGAAIAAKAPVVVQGLTGITSMLAKLRHQLNELRATHPAEAAIAIDGWRRLALPCVRTLRDELNALEQEVG